MTNANIPRSSGMYSFFTFFIFVKANKPRPKTNEFSNKENNPGKFKPSGKNGLNSPENK